MREVSNQLYAKQRSVKNNHLNSGGRGKKIQHNASLYQPMFTIYTLLDLP